MVHYIAAEIQLRNTLIIIRCTIKAKLDLKEPTKALGTGVVTKEKSFFLRKKNYRKIITLSTKTATLFFFELTAKKLVYQIRCSLAATLIYPPQSTYIQMAWDELG